MDGPIGTASVKGISLKLYAHNKRLETMVRATIYKAIARRRFMVARRLIAQYQWTDDPAAIHDFQLARIREVWKSAVTRVPFYAWWAANHGLPPHISSLEEFAEFPVLTKAQIRENRDLIMRSPDVLGWYSTGGSSGEPVEIPHGPGEADRRFANIQVLRQWAGLDLGARYVHLWGHAHLFGADGVGVGWQRFARQGKDWLVGSKRLDAYDQSLDAALRYLRAVYRFNPRYIVGYTSSLLRLSHAAESTEWRPPTGLHTVVATAETVSPGDRLAIERGLGVPCAIEYGSAETGVVSGSTGNGTRMRVLWRDHLVSVNDGQATFTSLCPRSFPLIRYDLGDVLSTDREGPSVLSLVGVLGRAKDVVSLDLADGRVGEFRAGAFVHVAKAFAPLDAVQVAQLNAGRVGILLVPANGVVLSQSAITNALADGVGRSLGSIAAESLTVKIARSAVPSVAGKVNLVITAEEFVRKND